MVYTIGYEGKEIVEFIEILKNKKIEILIDIREFPISRKKDFSKKNLKKYLVKENIQYFHFKDLGTPKDLRNKVRKNKNYNLFFKEYRRLLNYRKNIFNDLLKIIDGKIVCLICLEKDYRICHRKIICEKIKNKKNIKICHI